MDPERWRQIEGLYHAARERKPDERNAYIAEVCQGDEGLRREVESLLRQDVSTNGPLEHPAAALLEERTVTQLTAGYQLGPYKIEAALGGGGMGEVFEATDTRLGRKVAVKVAKAEFTSRFQREARAISALNHPHICTLYDVGPNYLVMELVEGETLAARLRKAKLSLEQTIQYGVQIADALAAAHAKGITHRDLKPANIMLAKSGVKVLDFGLAKSRQDASLTGTQVVMGTPAYMAPEQREGKDCDARTDIYALGLVLREMATDFTPHLARVIDRCLETDPENRWDSAKDVKFQLETTPPEARPPAPRAPLGWIVAGTLALALAAVSFLYFRETQPRERTLRYTIAAPENSTVHSFAISPDGRQLAIAAQANGKRQLWLRTLDALQTQPMPDTDDATYPFWSPDSRHIAFFAQGKLKKIAASGGPAQSLCDVPDGRGGTWNRDDVIVFSRNVGAIQRVSASGGVPIGVIKTEGQYRSPVFVPLADARHFLYAVVLASPERNGLYLTSLDGKDNRRVLADASIFAIGSDRLLFVHENTLMAQLFDAENARLFGDVIPVAEGISFIPNSGYVPISVSESGVLVYGSGSSVGSSQVAWFDRAGKISFPAGAPGAAWEPAISPDEKAVAFRRAYGSNDDIWLRDLTRGTDSRLTFGASNWDPFWSPKGDRIAFVSNRSGPYNLYQQAVSGAGREELLVSTSNTKAVDQWSLDGRFIVYTENDPRTKNDLWVVPAGESAPADRKPIPFLQTEFNELQGQMSPDGHWMAYTSDESGRREIYVRPFRSSGGKWRISTEGGEQPRWRADGKELFFVSADGKMTAATVKAVAEPNRSFEAGVPVPLFQTNIASAGIYIAFEYDVTADGNRFLVNTTATTSTPSLTVVVNWAAGLKK